MGKGGSGKTSIAYEFARVLRQHGQGLQIYDGTKIDNVIFLTAKELSLNPVDGEQRSIAPDFSDECSLYVKLLQYGGWNSDECGKARHGVRLNEHLEHDCGLTVFQHEDCGSERAAVMLMLIQTASSTTSILYESA